MSIKSIKFNIPFVAVQERARIGKYGQIYDPSKKVKQTIWLLALESRQKQQLSILGGDLHVFVVCHGFRGKDLDNAIKLILDACNGVIYKDDDQVTYISARKFAEGEPCMEVEIVEVEEEGVIQEGSYETK